MFNYFYNLLNNFPLYILSVELKAWVLHNTININFSKTKEIVFHRPNPYHSVNPLPVDDIEQLTDQARVLGVIVNGNFCFDSRIKFVMRIYIVNS